VRIRHSSERPSSAAPSHTAPRETSCGSRPTGWSFRLEGKTDLGHQLSDDTFYLALNASEASVVFIVPPCPTTSPWEVMVDTATSKIPVMRRVAAREPLTLVAKSFALLRSPRDL
jgi:hypothetical protein